MSKVENWKTISQETLFKSEVCCLYSEKCQLPDGRVMPNYYVFDCPDWVQILPITKDGNLVLVEQFRQGQQEVGLEIPGGTLHFKSNEAPDLAAKREMEEETGFTSDSVEFVCKHSPNPAMMRNHVHLYIAKNAEKKFEQKLDPYEDIAVHIVSPKDLKSLVRSGRIHHSVVLASFLFLQDYINI